MNKATGADKRKAKKKPVKRGLVTGGHKKRFDKLLDDAAPPAKKKQGD